MRSKGRSRCIRPESPCPTARYSVPANERVSSM
jgi:hypothetical protein